MKYRKSLLSLSYEGNSSEEDKQAWGVFSLHYKDFDFDSGSLESRDREAERFTKMYFEGTPYCVVIEEYCAFCTEACVYKYI